MDRPTKEEIAKRCEVLKKGKGRLICRLLDEIAEEGLFTASKPSELTKINISTKAIIEKKLNEQKEEKPLNNGYDLDLCPF